MSEPNKPTPPVRNVIRSRMRAAPNVAISSGMARNRRLSGHFQAPEKNISNNEPNKDTNNNPIVSNEISKDQPDLGNLRQPSRSRSPSLTKSPSPYTSSFNENATARTTILNTHLNSIPSSLSSIPSIVSSILKPKSPAHDYLSRSPRVPFISKINSPKITDSNELFSNVNSHSPNVVHANQNQSISNLSFRQFINYQSNVLQKQPNVNLVPLSPSVSYNGPPTPHIMPCTPGGTEYNPKFSNEHIMNIIKHKSMQKLKKIEAESLKEKRKSYQAILNDLNRSNLDNSLMANNGNDVQNIPIDRSKTRMRDLLYYNSKTKKTVDNPNETTILDTTTPINTSINSEKSNSPTNSENSTLINDEEEKIKKKKQEELLNSAPQLKFAEDGSIIINEQSLIIEREDQVPVYDKTVVESEQIDNLTYISYRKFHHTKKWTERETAKFYKALSMIGTDFTMIQRLFNHRSRDEIKRKFKREEKLNQALIDKIMSTTCEIDLSIFVSASSDDEARKKSSDKNQKNTKTIKKRVPKEKPPVEPKAKLKRIQKRTFIESESENEEDKNKNKKGQNLLETNVTDNLNIPKIVDIPVLVASNENEINDNKDDNAESDDDEEEMVLDLDNNTITSQNSVLNVTNYNSESNQNILKGSESDSSVEIEIFEGAFSNEKIMMDNTSDLNNGDNSESQEEDNIILDLDNNTIVSNTGCMNIDFPTKQDKDLPISKSKIVITPIIKKKS